MLIYKTLRQSLIVATSLVAVGMLSPHSPVQAASFNFSTTGNPGQTLGTGETGVVQSGGGITAAALGVLVTGSALSIDNSGTITGSASLGIQVSSGGDITGGIVNSGAISGHFYGIAVFAGGSSGGITNNAGGTIIGGGGGGNAIYLFNPTVPTAITNNVGGTITNGGGGGAAINLFNLTVPAALAINGGQIIGNVTDNSPGNLFSPVTIGGDFTTQGNFNVSSIAVNTAKTLTVGTGNTLAARAFTFGVQDAATFGKIVMTDTGFALNAPIGADDGQIQVNVTGAGIVAGDQWKIVDGDGVNAIVNGPGAVLTSVIDNSALWSFEVADGTGFGGDNTDLFLLIVSNVSFNPSTPGNEGSLHTLLGLAGPVDPTLQTIIDNVNAASNETAFNDTLASTLPGVNGADYESSQEVGDAMLGFEEIRLASLRSGDDATTGMAAGDIAHGVSTWGQVFGQHSDQGERDNIAGYTANTWGGALGLDSRNVSDKSVVGLAFSYGRTTANSDNSNSTDTNVDSYQFSLYGDYDIAKDTYLNGMAGYTWGNADETRHNVGGVSGLTAHGNYNTKQFSAQAEVGHNYTTSQGMVLTPNLLAHWVNWNPDSYTETGAGGANLKVNGNTLNKFELGAGLKAGWSVKNADGSWLKPQLRAGYRYDLNNDRIEDTAQFTGGGGAFSVPGPAPARSTLDLGASLKFLTTNNWDFTASYDFNWKSDYTSSSGFLRATYRF